MEILQKENILLNVENITREEAIKRVGQLLVDSGYVYNDYIEDMFERENVVNTYIGNGVAIPHGISHSEEHIMHSGIAILQSKEGIQYGENEAYLVIGIAGVNDEHLNILSNIALLIQEVENIKKLVETDSIEEIYSMLLTEVN